MWRTDGLDPIAGESTYFLNSAAELTRHDAGCIVDETSRMYGVFARYGLGVSSTNTGIRSPTSPLVRGWSDTLGWA